MPHDLTEVENELRSASQEQHRVQKYILEIRQHISQDETWLTMNTPATPEYQETLQELLALQAYIAELGSQATSLDDVMLDLTLEQVYLRNPEVLLAS
jgi:hypothetical protein